VIAQREPLTRQLVRRGLDRVDLAHWDELSLCCFHEYIITSLETEHQPYGRCQ
jgi:hypothetical protein